jgi:hypothetical protein
VTAAAVTMLAILLERDRAIALNSRNEAVVEFLNTFTSYGNFTGVQPLSKEQGDVSALFVIAY